MTVGSKASGLAHRNSQSGVVCKRTERLGKCSRITRRDKKACLAIYDDIGDASYSRADDR